jgi:putative addiction module killer protein
LPIEVRQTLRFARWLDALPDRKARDWILVRIRRLSLELAGDVGPVGGGVSELRIDYGPGYRVYFIRRHAEQVTLLAGGDKRTQGRDIKAARKLAERIQGE